MENLEVTTSILIEVVTGLATDVHVPSDHLARSLAHFCVTHCFWYSDCAIILKDMNVEHSKIKKMREKAMI